MEAHFQILKAGKRKSRMLARKFVFYFLESKLVLFDENENVRRSFKPSEISIVRQDAGGLRLTITFKGGGSYSSRTERPIQFISLSDVERFLKCVAKFTDGQAQLLGANNELLNNLYAPARETLQPPASPVKLAKGSIAKELDAETISLGRHMTSRGSSIKGLKEISETASSSHDSYISEEEEIFGDSDKEDEGENDNEESEEQEEDGFMYFKVKIVNRFGKLEEKHLSYSPRNGLLEFRSLSQFGNWNSILNAKDISDIERHINTMDICLGFAPHIHSKGKGLGSSSNNYSHNNNSDSSDDDDDGSPVKTSSKVAVKIIAWVYIQFENDSERQRFLDFVAHYANSMYDVDPETSESGSFDMLRGWHHFKTIARRAPNAKGTKTFAMNIKTRDLYIFKTSTLRDGQLTDSSEPEEKYNIKPNHLHVEMVLGKSHTSVRWGIIRDGSVVANREEMMEVTLESSTSAQLFYGCLKAIGAPIPKILAPGIEPPSLNNFPRSKYHRHTWNIPTQDWYTNTFPVFVGSFNTGDAGPVKEFLLSTWIPKPKAGAAARIYAIGLQECPKFVDWVKAIQAHLNPATYKLVTAARLWEIGLVIFAHIDEMKHISMIDTCTEATGVAVAKGLTGMQLGNKGGVAAGFLWRDVSICFLSCHLAAHQESVKERNRDAAQILSKLTLSSGEFEGVDLPFAFEHVFLCGDLNYRVDTSFTNAAKLATKSAWKELNAFDQLAKERREGRVFCDWDVAATNFAPTYRWKRNRKEFSNKKDQPPSYTDRILWHSRPGVRKNVSLVDHNCVEEIMVSDHRPIFAKFMINIREGYLPWPFNPLVMSIPFSTEASSRLQEDSAAARSAGVAKKEVKVLGGLPLSAFSTKGDMSLSSSFPIVASSAANAGNKSDDTNSSRDARVPWLGNSGSFILERDEAIIAFSPEIKLENIVVHLERDDDTGAPQPPSFLTLKFLSRILHTCDSSATMPGSETHPDEVLSGKEPIYAYTTSQQSKSLYYSWKASEGKNLPRLLPRILDPAYLSSHHITVCAEIPSSRDEKIGVAHAESIRQGAATLGNIEEDADGLPLERSSSALSTNSNNAQRKSIGSRAVRAFSLQSGFGPRQKRLNSVAANSNGNSSSQSKLPDLNEDSDTVFLPTSKGNTSLVGTAAIPIKYVVDAVRRIGLVAWQSGSNCPSIPFSEPFIRAGIKVGTITGEIKILPGDSTELRRIITQRNQQAVASRSIDIVKTGIVEVATLDLNNYNKKNDVDSTKKDGYLSPTMTPMLDLVKVSILLTRDGHLYLLPTSRKFKTGVQPKPTSKVQQVIDISLGGTEANLVLKSVDVSGDLLFSSNSKIQAKIIENPRTILRIRCDNVQEWMVAIQNAQVQKRAVAQSVSNIQPESFKLEKKTSLMSPKKSSTISISSTSKQSFTGKIENLVQPSKRVVSGEILIQSLVGLLKTGLSQDDPALAAAANFQTSDSSSNKEVMYVPPPPPPPE